jgi:oligopeptide/dipeptide ABC transporter ATP-binding protein
LSQASAPLLRVEKLVIQYDTESGPLTAVDDFSLDIRSGEILGVVGESGCGKTTFAQSIMGILPVNATIKSGRILFEGTNLLEMPRSNFRDAIMWKRIAMVFQSSMNALNPVYTIGHVLANAARFKLGISREEAERLASSLLSEVGLDSSWMRAYPHQLSGGMKQRVVIALSLICKPSLIIADEPTTALDVIVQAQILALLKKLNKDLGISIMLISHDLAIISQICDRIAVLYAGELFELGSRSDILKSACNPYTRALLNCFPDKAEPKKKLRGIPGTLILKQEYNSCRFVDRCGYARDICKFQLPPFVSLNDGHGSLCHFARELQT